MMHTTHELISGDLGAFIDVGERARREYACFWQPGDALRSQFSAANPWFQAGQRARLLAGEYARVAVFAPAASSVGGERVCFFGFFECVEDGDRARAEVARLLDVARAWAREQGATRLYGPIDFSTFGDYRLKVSQEDGGEAFLGEPHNPAYYTSLIEAAGMEASSAYLTQIFDSRDIASKRLAKGEVRDALTARGYRFEPLTVAFWMDNLERLHALTDSIFGGNFAYTPIPFEMFRVACGERFIRRCDPMASVACLAPDGTIAGVFLVYPHYGALLGPGRMVSADELDFKNHWPEIKAAPMVNTAIMKTVGVRRDQRRAGIMDALTVEVFERGADRYARWFGALIRDDNPSRRFADGAHPDTRTYALYSSAC